VFIDTVHQWCQTVDLSTLTSAYQAWQEKVEAYNEMVSDLASDYEMHSDERSEKWLESARGQQVQETEQALRNAMMDTDAVSDITLTLDTSAWDLRAEDAEDALPETPELPEEAE
jgi:hypothetical protein